MSRRDARLRSRSVRKNLKLMNESGRYSSKRKKSSRWRKRGSPERRRKL